MVNLMTERTISLRQPRILGDVMVNVNLHIYSGPHRSFVTAAYSFVVLNSTTSQYTNQR